MDTRERHPGPAVAGTAGDRAVLAALRRGDEQAFVDLVERYHPGMLRLATIHTGSRAVAEEVVQEAWLGVISGLDRFEGRSSLRTWIYAILVNTAKTRGQREKRSLPFSAFFDPAEDSGEPAVDPDRFLPADDRWAGHWAVSPRTWAGRPQEVLLAAEGRGVIEAAIRGLPPAQREVITLRDVEGCSAEEACEALGVSEGNQRVLLHRARSRVRAALEAYVDAS